LDYSAKRYASEDNRFWRNAEDDGRGAVAALVAAAQQPRLERAQLAASEAAGEHRVLVHDLPRGRFVERLEDGDVRVVAAAVRAAGPWCGLRGFEQRSARRRALERFLTTPEV
jgi:hypothetical protein